MTVESRTKECCMCGDMGFSDEIFQCKACLHRFQHKYCSCLYPKTDSYQTCDWCLRSHREANRKSLHRCTDEKKSFLIGHDQHAIKKQKSTGGVERPSTTGNIKGVNVQCYSASARGQIGNERIHKQGAAEGRCVRRGTVMMSCKEDLGSNQQQVQIPSSKPSTPRPLVRGKVRRYKLLEEVSSWFNNYAMFRVQFSINPCWFYSFNKTLDDRIQNPMNSFSYVLLCAGVVSDYTNGELDYISEVADILFDIHTPHRVFVYFNFHWTCSATRMDVHFSK